MTKAISWGSAARAHGENPQKHQCQGQLTKELDVHLLQRVHAAELVQLVVDLVEDESLVVVSRVVLDDVVHWERREHRDGAGREGQQGKELSTPRETLGLSPSTGAVKSGTSLTLKPSGQGRFIYC